MPILTGSLTDEQRARLLEVAEKCPVTFPRAVEHRRNTTGFFSF